MGSPKKQRKKFSKPSHPWQKERILAEQDLLKEYGLNRKYEIWKMNSILKNFTKQAKNLVTIKNPQVEKERSQLLTKLNSLGLMGKDSKIEEVLSLTLKDIMERRLQTLVFRKNLARSFKQARQFIVHEHITLGERTITTPSYLVPLKEESSIQFTQTSSFIDPSHPERVVAKKSSKSQKKSENEMSKSEDKADEGKKEEEKQTKEEKPAEKKKAADEKPKPKAKVSKKTKGKPKDKVEKTENKKD